MIIESLKLVDFRNYESLDISLDPGTNILYGDNAQGKTNILEAIYLSATTKSHKGSKDSDIIAFGKDESHIRTIIKKDDIETKIDMHLRKNKSKGIAVDGVKLKKASELLGLLNVVFFSPEDLSIIKNGPAERRRFIDMELCQLDKFYIYNLNQYNKIINQRNHLLKEIYNNPELKDTLKIWDSQLASYGSKIIERRIEFIDRLNDIISSIHQGISGGREKMVIKYEPNCDADRLEEGIASSYEKDIKLKQTTIGPHRDDISFIVTDSDSKSIDIRKFGSQGQQRTAALSLKLSEIELVKKIIGDTPVLLLDDVLSELDSNRQNYLLDSIGDIQTIITCTGLDDFVGHRFEIDRVFKITKGKICDDDHNDTEAE